MTPPYPSTVCSNVDAHRLKTRWLIDRGILTLGKAEQEAVKLMQKSIRDASIISDKKHCQLSVRHVKTYGDNDIISLSIIVSLAAKQYYFSSQFIQSYAMAHHSKRTYAHTVRFSF